jgi:hypothetical protein
VFTLKGTFYLDTGERDVADLFMFLFLLLCWVLCFFKDWQVFIHDLCTMQLNPLPMAAAQYQYKTHLGVFIQVSF